MGNYRFKHIPEDAVIMGVGSLFKKNSNVLWGINLSFSKKLDRPSIPIAGVPLIRRYKTLSYKQSNKVKGKRLSFTVNDAQRWQRKRLNECPAFHSMTNAKDPQQWCFEFSVDDGTSVFLPQLELARVLFLHDNYMSRICLEHGKLSSDFNITSLGEHWQINVMPSSKYPIAAYNDERSRRFLSWILIDAEARASFESIHQTMMREHTNRGQYQFWDFSFTPPSLNGTKIEVTGWHDWSSDSFFVWEIRRVEDLPSSMPNELDFYHPDFRRQVTGQGGGTFSSKPQRPEEHELDDEEDADPDKKRVSLDTESVGLSFLNPFKTNRVTDKTRNASRGKPDENEPGEHIPNKLSPNGDSIKGTIAGADYDVLNDESDDAHLYASKFDIFFQVVDRLEANHECKIYRYPIRKLPKLARCTKHMMADDLNPRCMAVIKVTYKGEIFHLIEVDTSDAKKSISTMVLKLKDNSALEEQIGELEIRLLKKSLSWPRDYISLICGEGNFKGISHPSCKHKGFIDPADIDKWAGWFKVWLDN
ncbi:Tn7-like element transposition protein TnsE [Vibrio sp.]|uniref:Tn7-like element transposition protein TnsE n=1 Tax=Vibrio sp. TaxID=678 RepID=UPI00311E2ED3